MSWKRKEKLLWKGCWAEFWSWTCLIVELVLEQALMLNPTDPCHQVKLVTLTKRLVGGNPLVSVNITWFCFCLLIFVLVYWVSGQKAEKFEILRKILGCRNGAPCSAGAKNNRPGENLATEHPEFFGAPAPGKYLDQKNCKFLFSPSLWFIFTPRRCEVSLGEGLRRLLTRFFLLFFSWVSLSQFLGSSQSKFCGN